MAETYYTGPIALAVAKPYGGDLGEFGARSSTMGADAFPFGRLRVQRCIHILLLPSLPHARNQVLQALRRSSVAASGSRDAEVVRNLYRDQVSHVDGKRESAWWSKLYFLTEMVTGPLGRLGADLSFLGPHSWPLRDAGHSQHQVAG